MEWIGRHHLGPITARRLRSAGAATGAVVLLLGLLMFQWSPHLFELQHEALNTVEHGAGVHGRGAEAAPVEQTLRLLASLHPLVVHFPIALMISAAAAELIAILFARGDWCRAAARFCVAAAAVGALGAAITGWLAGIYGGYGGDMEAEVNIHRWAGLTAGACTLLAFLSSELAWRLTHPAWKWMYRLMLVIGSAAVTVAGHFGASLVFGSDYFSRL